MPTPLEIYKVFAPYISISKNNNIIYQNKKIFIKDIGILIFDMDMGEVEDIYFPNTIFNTILKAKEPLFKIKDNVLVVESKSNTKTNKTLKFSYFKLDKNIIHLPDKKDYNILATL